MKLPEKLSYFRTQRGLASLEAALFIGLIFLPFFIGMVSLWGYFTLVESVSSHIAKVRSSLSAVNLQLHTGLRGTFPRERKMSPNDSQESYNPYASYDNVAQNIAALLEDQWGIHEATIEVGFLSARLLPPDGSSLIGQFGEFTARRTNATPPLCNRWKQPGSTSTLVICSDTAAPRTYNDSKLWSLFKHHALPSETLNSTAYPGRAWTAHSHRRVQRALGSSVWLSTFEREGQDAHESIDGNDYAWANHPRFGVMSGYVIEITLDNALFSLFQGTTSPKLIFYGLFPVRQEL